MVSFTSFKMQVRLGHLPCSSERPPNALGVPLAQVPMLCKSRQGKEHARSPSQEPGRTTGVRSFSPAQRGASLHISYQAEDLCRPRVPGDVTIPVPGR